MNAELLAAAPPAIQALPRDHRGFPIPWFVAHLEDGARDFRIMGPRQMQLAVRKDLCWVCGRRNHPLKSFVIGPMCAVNLTSGEPPNHPDCARWSAQACPFLTKPRMRRNEKGLPTDSRTAEGYLDRNPGVALVWTTRRFRAYREQPGDGLFFIGKPHKTEWFCQGRPATRDEVMASIKSGLPELVKVAAIEGEAALAMLARMTEDALQTLPEAA